MNGAIWIRFYWSMQKREEISDVKNDTEDSNENDDENLYNYVIK